MTDVHIYRRTPTRDKACVVPMTPAAIEWTLNNMDLGPFDGGQIVIDLECVDELEQAFAEAGLSVEES